MEDLDRFDLFLSRNKCYGVFRHNDAAFRRVGLLLIDEGRLYGCRACADDRQFARGSVHRDDVGIFGRVADAAQIDGRSPVGDDRKLQRGFVAEIDVDHVVGKGDVKHHAFDLFRRFAAVAEFHFRECHGTLVFAPLADAEIKRRRIVKQPCHLSCTGQRRNGVRIKEIAIQPEVIISICHCKLYHIGIGIKCCLRI